MRQVLSGILFVFSVMLLSISIYFLMGMFQEYRQTDRVNNELQQLHEQQATETEQIEEPVAEDSHEAKPSPTPTPCNEEDTQSEEPRYVDSGLVLLHEKNPDCIFWITIPETVIDYPVMYHPGEKDYYLHRDFYGNYLASGTLYLAENCDSESSDNLIVYGHHMQNGSMFAHLDKYKSEDFFKKHPQIILQTLQGEEIYRILAAFTTPVYTGHDFTYYSFTHAQSEKEYLSFVEACLSRSLYDTGTTAAYGQRLLTLSTCEYSQENGRMVIVAVRETT